MTRREYLEREQHGPSYRYRIDLSSQVIEDQRAPRQSWSRSRPMLVVATLLLAASIALLCCTLGSWFPVITLR